MKILLTGVTGYIAQRLLPVLLDRGHEVVCCVRDLRRFDPGKFTTPLQGQDPPTPHQRLTVVEVDFLKPETLDRLPQDVDLAYYLIHSMSTRSGDFGAMEEISAENFRRSMEATKVRQVVYLSGISNAEVLSKHLASRRRVETLLTSPHYALTTLRAGIIVGSGSASFEIIRDLVEKLPVMVAPRWLLTRCQPIAIRNVIEFLVGVIAYPQSYNRSFDIGGQEILTYKEMLLQFAGVRGLQRRIWIVPVMTPRISSYWLYFVTSTSYALATNLVNSMKVEVIAQPNTLAQDLGIQLIDYRTAIRLAFDKIEQNEVISSWKDAQTSEIFREGFARYAEVPVNGCFRDSRKIALQNPEQALDKIWRIGGKTGWYYGTFWWELRGIVDQVFGGVGMRRGRKSDTLLQSGDTLDFWRVMIADRNQKRLLLLAEMKLPGEAWLEFRIDEQGVLTQTATFRPKGLNGRLYWYAVSPLHHFIFEGMLRRIAGNL